MNRLLKEIDTVKHVPFDTLAYVKKLEAHGVDAKQAEAQAEVLAEVLEVNFSSKKDSRSIIGHFTTEFEKFRQEMNTKIAELRQEMNTKIAELRQEMNVKLAELKAEIIKWVLGISFVQAALIISVLKFFH